MLAKACKSSQPSHCRLHHDWYITRRQNREARPWVTVRSLSTVTFNVATPITARPLYWGTLNRNKVSVTLKMYQKCRWIQARGGNGRTTLNHFNEMPSDSTVNWLSWCEAVDMKLYLLSRCLALPSLGLLDGQHEMRVFRVWFQPPSDRDGGQPLS